MRRDDFNYPSGDRITEIHAALWIPEGEVRGILQISHGMVEHIERYAPFGEFLSNEGILVVGNDHLGHGRSIADKDELAHFPSGGNQILLEDMHTLRQKMQKKYPEVPYFILGHSMGSFLTRQYLCLNGEGLAGAIIMGTGEQAKGLLLSARALADVDGRLKGRKHHSRTLTKIAFGAYNKEIKNPESSNAWLTRDEIQVQKYDADPLCGMVFTNQAFSEMFRSMLYLKDLSHLLQMPKKMPVLFVSGEQDPVGDYGKAVRAVRDEFLQAGMANVELKLYPEDRHEVLNELNREEVFLDILNWINAKI